MTKKNISLFLTINLLAWVSLAQEVQFTGHLNFEIQTTLPGFSTFKAKTKEKALIKAKHSKTHFQNLSLKLDPKLVETGISLRNKHMVKKVFKNKPIEFSSEKIKCKDNKKLCTVNGVLKIGDQKTFVDLEFKQIKEGVFEFEKEFSLKALKVKKIGYLNLTVKDKVLVRGEFSRVSK